MRTFCYCSLCLGMLICGTSLNPKDIARRYLNPVFSHVTKKINLTYGRSLNDRARLQTHLLDLYEPTKDILTARPVIVLIHGGGFTGGNKADMSAYAVEFARRGYVAVSINYRLATKPMKTHPPDANFIAAVDDAKEDAFGAIRWLRANAGRYRLDKGRIAVMGFSAGAITALAVNFDQETQRHENDGGRGQSTAISTIVEMAGGIDTTWISPNEKPVLIIHGTKDDGVSFAYALAINKACQAKNIPVMLQPAQDATHNLSPFFSRIASGTPQWFKAYMVDAKPVY